MPTAEQHEAAARRHLKAYEATVEKFPDWAAVMLFYAALHTLERTFALDGRHNRSHPDREVHIKTTCGSVWPPYHRLQNESLKARYLQGGGFSLNSKAVQNELRAKHFRKIEDFAQARLRAREQR